MYWVCSDLASGYLETSLVIPAFELEGMRALAFFYRHDPDPHRPDVPEAGTPCCLSMQNVLLEHRCSHPPSSARNKCNTQKSLVITSVYLYKVAWASAMYVLMQTKL